MPAQKPEECDLLLLEAIGKEDLDAAVAMYEPNATFVVSADQVVTGQAAIREVLQGFIAAKATFNVEAVTAIPSADGSVAVTRVKGSSTSPGPDGQPVTTPLHSVEVVRKQPDGTWLFIIDDPSGEGLK
jgi:ketosteroid isomerase-like protein